MGSLQSILSAELIAAGVILGAATAGYWAVTNGVVELPALNAPDSGSLKKAGNKERAGLIKKGKKKKGVTNEPMPVEDDDEALLSLPGAISPIRLQPPSRPSSTIAPEVLAPAASLFSAPPPPTTLKEKKRKAKKEASSTSVAGPTAAAAQQPDIPSTAGSSKPAPSTSKSTTSSKTAAAKPAVKLSAVDNESWTRVETRRNKAGRVVGDVSDTGITTSVTEEEEGGSAQSSTKDEKMSLEKLMPKKRKTAVDDMLEKGSQPELARVLRIEPERASTTPTVRIQPSPTDKPADGFTWGDYEDVAKDAEAPWTESRSKKPKRNPSTSGNASGGNSSAPETGPTKKQRQNAAKREAEKNSKVEAEAVRVAQLAKYKREQDKVKMDEQYKNQKAGKGLSGGMKASVDPSGSLVWD